MAETTDNLMLDQKRDAGLITALLGVTQSDAAVHLSLDDVEVRLVLLEGYWNECRRRDYLLQRCSDALKERTYFKSDTYKATLEKYLSAKAWFSRRIRELSLPAAPPPANTGQLAVPPSDVSSTQASLEKLKLPHFNGDQRQWEAFKDKFTALIINDHRMDPIIKIQHLTNCLGEEPAEKLRGIKCVGVNFQTAWEPLCKRYDNIYLRFSVQIETLVNMPSATSEKVKHLCHLINLVDESINTFTALKRKCENWDDIYVYFVETKLAETTRLDWIKQKESKKMAGGFAKYADLKGFLEERIRSLDVVQSRVERPVRYENLEYPNAFQAPYKEKNGPSTKRNSKGTAVHVAMQKPPVTYSGSTCLYCKGEHFIGYCPKFAACPTAQRQTHVVSAKLCFNCLNSNHSADMCRSKGRCFVCSNKHHTKLHLDAPSITNAVAITSESNNTEAFNALANTQQTASLTAIVTARVLLSTACVVLQAPNGQSLTVRALLDSGAEESFVSEYVAQALSLKKRPANVVVSGAGGSTTAVARNRISVYLKSNQNSDFCFTVSALVLKKLTTFIPRSEIPMQDWSHLSGLQLADPHFNIPSRIDCVLNSEAYAASLLPGIKRGAPGMPVAVKSMFGWVLMGAAHPESIAEPENISVHHITVDSGLSTVLARFWESEEPPGEEMLSPAEQTCSNHFRTTHSRNEEGRFVVRLPFVNKPSSLNTHEIAESCFHRLERRFAKH